MDVSRGGLPVKRSRAGTGRCSDFKVHSGNRFRLEPPHNSITGSCTTTSFFMKGPIFIPTRDSKQGFQPALQDSLELPKLCARETQSEEKKGHHDPCQSHIFSSNPAGLLSTAKMSGLGPYANSKCNFPVAPPYHTHPTTNQSCAHPELTTWILTAR